MNAQLDMALDSTVIQELEKKLHSHTFRFSFCVYQVPTNMTVMISSVNNAFHCYYFYIFFKNVQNAAKAQEKLERPLISCGCTGEYILKRSSENR